jgi:Winged helix-turn helix
MATTDGAFSRWLTQAGVAAERLTVEQTAVLHAAFRYRQRLGTDYYSTRLLGHVLLHCDCGIPVAQIARLLAISRPTASRQQGRASKEVIQAAHHRMAGRSHGKLLPRYAGPIAEFVLSHPDASRFDTIDFIERTWGVRVSTVALHKFLKKYGLDRASRAAALASPDAAAVEAAAPPAPIVPAEPPAALPPGQPVPLPAPPFSSRRRTTRGRSC